MFTKLFTLASDFAALVKVLIGPVDVPGLKDDVSIDTGYSGITVADGVQR
jgi:hypothetical protein